jgi:hypothetical protein
VSYDSGSHLSVEVGSDAATYPVVSCEPWVSSIKKMLAVLPVQLVTHVPNTCAQVFKAPDMACKTFGQAAQLMLVRCADMQL